MSPQIIFLFLLYYIVDNIFKISSSDSSIDPPVDPDQPLANPQTSWNYYQTFQGEAMTIKQLMQVSDDEIKKKFSLRFTLAVVGLM